MTKHLRFLFVMLLAMIWSAGWAQTTVDFSNGLPTDWSKTGTIKKYTYDSKSGIQLQKNTSITSPAFEDAYSSMKFSLKRSSNATTFTISYQIGNASAVVFKTFKAADVAQKSWNDCTIGIPAAAQVANCKFIFTSATSSYYISSIEFTLAGPTKTATNVSFGANTGNTFTFTEGEYTDGTFTAPTATETKGIEGTIVYSSDNESAVKVNASTGALSFPGYGEATITATFTPTDTETYAVSTDSYKVKNEAKKSDNILTFSNDFHSFDNAAKYAKDLPEVNVSFVGSDNNSYTFTTNGGKETYGGIQRFILKKTKGKLVSPAFSSYVNGYNVVITYGIGGDGYPSVTASGKTVTGTVQGDYTKGTGATLSLDVADGSAFTVTSGNNALAISKIEITPNAVDETETITLDESVTNTIEAQTGVNVTLKRSMVANEWNTICLPFDVTMDKAKAAFGDNVKIVELDTKAAVDANVLSFKASTGIVAATPYLIKPSAVADEYTFENVDITNNEAGYSMTDNADVAFKGIYNMVDITKDVVDAKLGDYYAAFLGAGNKIYKAGTGKTKGFRAYFAIPKSASASALRVVIDGTATSIKNIDSEVVESNAPVYNLQGQRVDGNNLTPGIYVKAGKKFVVK